MANKSKAGQTTPVPKSVANVIHFFLLRKFHRDDDTIDLADLKKYLGSEFGILHRILTEIRDEEAKSWDEADSDNPNEVVNFLDEISKMETEGSGES